MNDEFKYTLYLGKIPFGIYKTPSEANTINKNYLRGKGRLGTISQANLEKFVRELTAEHEIEEMLRQLKQNPRPNNQEETSEI